jgi:hypothetical protein
MHHHTVVPENFERPSETTEDVDAESESLDVVRAD